MLLRQTSAATRQAPRLMPRWSTTTVGALLARARRSRCSGAYRLSELLKSPCQSLVLSTGRFSVPSTTLTSTV